MIERGIRADCRLFDALGRDSRRIFRAVVVGLLISFTAFQPPAYAVDPIVAINTATAIIKLWDAVNTAGTRDQQLSNVQNQLAQINSRLDVLSSQMQEVLQELKRLGAKIDDAHDQDARDRVIAMTKFITANYAGWVTHWSRKEYKTAARDTLKDLQIATSQLMLRRSYANFQTVALAMTTERIMFDLIGSEKEFRHDRFVQFVEYFEGSLNPGIPSSLAERRNYYAGEAGKIKAVHNRVDAWSPIVEFIGDDRRVKQDDSNQTCTYSVWRHISGNVERGYKVTGTEELRSERNCQRDRERDGSNRPDRHGSGLTMSFAVRLLAQLDSPMNECVGPEAGRDWVCFAALHAGHLAYVAARKNEDQLSVGMDQAKEFLIRAREIRDRHARS